MAVSANIAICVAISFFASAAVFYILRTRLSALEHQLEAVTAVVKARASAHAQLLGMNRGNLPNTPHPPQHAGQHINLIAVSDDELGSEYNSESDYTSEDDYVSNYDAAPGSIKTIQLLTGENTTIVTNIIEEVPVTEAVKIGHGSILETTSIGSGTEAADDTVSCTSSENESESSHENNSSPEDNDHGAEQIEMEAVISSEVANALVAIDIKSLTCPAMRALISEHRLAPNPSKLRKPELLRILQEAKQEAH